MARLATAYSHFKPYDPNLAKQRQLRLLATEIANRHAQDFFRTPVQIEVFCEEGSWRTWVSVAGVIYAAVAGYGSFRDGIEWIVKDARAFSEIVNRELVNSGHVPNAAVFRTERRVETPGRILRTLDEAAQGDLQIELAPITFDYRRPRDKAPKSPKEFISVAQRQRRRVLNILRDLDDKEEDAFFASLPKRSISPRLELELREEAKSGEQFRGKILETDMEGAPRLVVGPDGKSRRLPKPREH